MINYFNKKNKKISIDDNEISIYVCGPTVYNHVHIGNLRPIIFFSMLRNMFEFQGKKVRLIQNITDVDDKILNYSKENNKNWTDVAEEFTNSYFDVLKKYQINGIEFYKATDFIDKYVDVVSKLVIDEKAYENESGVYFRTKLVENYGEVSNQDIDQLEENTRIVNKNGKENNIDFAILKKDEEFGWQTKFGKVRPGWHLECFGIINSVLENNLTIHGGGIDLIFPHHENENAINLLVNNVPLAKHWMHVGMLTLDGEKMSKSLGNLILAKDFYQDYGPNILKYIYIQNSYSKPINITEDLIKSQIKFDTNIQSLIKFLDIYQKNENYEKTGYIKEFEKLIENISLPNIYSLLLKIVKDFNKGNILEENYYSVKKDIMTITKVLDLKYEGEVSDEDKKLVELLNSIVEKEEIIELTKNKNNLVKTRKGWSVK